MKIVTTCPICNSTFTRTMSPEALFEYMRDCQAMGLDPEKCVCPACNAAMLQRDQDETDAWTRRHTCEVCGLVSSECEPTNSGETLCIRCHHRWMSDVDDEM